MLADGALCHGLCFERDNGSLLERPFREDGNHSCRCDSLILQRNGISSVA